MNINELRSLVRDTIFGIEKGGLTGIEAKTAMVRVALFDRGRAPGCHVGLGRDLTPDETVEWYAGQLLDIVDNKAWFAMNPFITCVDRYCPEIV